MSSSQPPFTVTWDENLRTVRLVWAPGSLCTLAAATASTVEIAAAGRGSYGLFVDMRGIDTVDRDARQHYAHNQGGATCAALLAGSPKNRMIANFFIGLQRLDVPVRMFTDEHAAIEWIQTRP